MISERDFEPLGIIVPDTNEFSEIQQYLDDAHREQPLGRIKVVATNTRRNFLHLTKYVSSQLNIDELRQISAYPEVLQAGILDGFDLILGSFTLAQLSRFNCNHSEFLVRRDAKIPLINESQNARMHEVMSDKAPSVDTYGSRKYATDLAYRYLDTVSQFQGLAQDCLDTASWPTEHVPDYAMGFRSGMEQALISYVVSAEVSLLNAIRPATPPHAL